VRPGIHSGRGDIDGTSTLLASTGVDLSSREYKYLYQTALELRTIPGSCCTILK
jgi:hypothetical protein